MKLHSKGSRVSQSSYGPGTVTSSDEKYTVIEFDHHGRRVFMTDMVALAKTDEPAPNKPAKEKRRKAPAVKAAEAAAKAEAKPEAKTAVKAPPKAVTKSSARART